MAKHFSYAQVGSYFAESLGQDHPDDTELLDAARKLNDSQRVICLLSALVVSIHKNTSTLQKLEGRLNLIETQTAQTNQSTKELVTLAKIDVQKRIDEIMNDPDLIPRMPLPLKTQQKDRPAQPNPKPVAQPPQPKEPTEDPFQSVVSATGPFDGSPVIGIRYSKYMELRIKSDRAYRVFLKSGFRFRHQVTRESLLGLYDCGPKIAQIILDWLDADPLPKRLVIDRLSEKISRSKSTKKKMPKKPAAKPKAAKKKGK